jgi:uncharacterized membrane protein
MRTAAAIVTALALAAAVGCESPRSGGTSGGEGFKIVDPVLNAKVRQGETRTVAVSLDRGDLFKRDVTLEVKASKGLSVEPKRALIKARGKPDLTLRVTAAKDAAVGEYWVSLKGTPSTGEATSMDFMVSVVVP